MLINYLPNLFWSCNVWWDLE